MLTTLRALGTLLPACLLASASHAQLLWQATTGTAAYDETSVGFVAVPGGYVNVGRGGGNGTASALPNHFYLAKLSPSGTVLWQKSTSFASRNVKVLEAQAAAADASGQIYATGQCSELVVKHPASLYSFGLLVKFSAAGDTLWSQVLHGLSRSAYGKAVVTADGGVVVVGENDADRFIAKYSATGQLVWRRSYFYSSSLPGYLANLARRPAGGFIVAQPTNGGGLLPDQYLLLDEQGLLVGTSPTRPFLPHYGMLADNAGNVLDAARYLFKISPAGDTLWGRRYVQYGRTLEIRRAIAVPGSSNYLLAGTRFNTLDEDLSLLLVDQNGALLRDTLLVRYGGSEYPTGLHVDAQGNYLVGGYTSDGGPLGRADQFAFVLRNWNRLLPTRPVAIVATAYHLYPNPATGADRLQVATEAGRLFSGAYELRDLTGRLVQAGSSWPASGLPVRGLLTGLYLLRLREGERWLPALRLEQR